MPNIVYNRGKQLFVGSADWGDPAQTYRVLLAMAGYAPAAAHQFVADVTNELMGGGYSRKDLVNRAVAVDPDAGRADAMADAVAFSALASDQTYKWAVIYRFKTSDADSELICALDMGPAGVSLANITDHTIRWDGQATSGRIFSVS